MHVCGGDFLRRKRYIIIKIIKDCDRFAIARIIK
jgi:hypothetical protein